MDAISHERDLYDLSYHRGTTLGVEKSIGGRVLKPSPDRVLWQEDLKKRRYRLNRISKDLCKILQRNQALISCVGFATRQLHPGIENAAALEPAKRSLAPARPDTDSEEEVIQARIGMAPDDLRILTSSLKRINQVVMQININPSTTVSQGPTVLYRVTHTKSHTLYDVDLGFCCARWFQDHDPRQPTKADFRAHVGGDENFESPYISLTDDPGRAFNFGQSCEEQQVFVIDTAKLRQMNVHVQRTTVLADKWKIKYNGQGDRLHYVTHSHWLARFWIPAECIVDKVSFAEFKKACIASGIVDRNNSVVMGKTLPPDAFEQKSKNMVKRRVQRVVFADDEELLEEKMQSLSVNGGYSG